MAPVLPDKPLPFTGVVPVTNGTFGEGCSSITMEEIDYLNAENAADEAAKLLR